MRIDDMNGGPTDPDPAPANNDIRTLLMQEMQREQMQQQAMPPGPEVPPPAPPAGPPAPGPGASPDPMMMAQALRG